ncbi:hypothetical protein EXS72_01510 [Candidatus Pacearchaeota archaeon]|nr:hypothetical protein [Candidatus Pacearchaeota archaeon]
MMDYWYPFLGWSTLTISTILAIILYVIYRKLYPLFYLISISLYVFTAGFIIDVFNLPKGAILMVLVVSALLFMWMGLHFSKIFQSDNLKK